MARKEYRRRKLMDELSQFQRFFCALKFYHYRKRLEEVGNMSSEDMAEFLGKGLRSIQQIEEGEILPDPHFLRKCCRVFTDALKLVDRDGKPFQLRYQDFYGDEYWEVEDFMRACNTMKDWKNKLIVKVMETGKGRVVNWDGNRRVVFDF